MGYVSRSSGSFRLAGRSFVAFVLAPNPPIGDWIAELDNWLARSAGFFAGRPVVLDLSRHSLTRPDLAGLLAQLQARSIRIIAVEGVDPAWLGPGLSPLSSMSKPTNVIDFPEAAMPAPSIAPPPQPAKCASLLLDQPVRSGQTIYYPDGDVTVVGSVASGAEIIAGGSIHVYGTLRGRAIAGASGNTKARIFCTRFEAELLVIDGLYRTAEESEEHLRGAAIEAHLDGEAMIIARLD